RCTSVNGAACERRSTKTSNTPTRNVPKPTTAPRAAFTRKNLLNNHLFIMRSCQAVFIPTLLALMLNERIRAALSWPAHDDHAESGSHRISNRAHHRIPINETHSCQRHPVGRTPRGYCRRTKTT